MKAFLTLILLLLSLVIFIKVPGCVIKLGMKKITRFSTICLHAHKIEALKNEPSLILHPGLPKSP